MSRSPTPQQSRINSTPSTFIHRTYPSQTSHQQRKVMNNSQRLSSRLLKKESAYQTPRSVTKRCQARPRLNPRERKENMIPFHRFHNYPAPPS